MLFKYKAKKLSDGELVEGARESEGKFSLLRELKEEGLSLLVAGGNGRRRYSAFSDAVKRDGHKDRAP